MSRRKYLVELVRERTFRWDRHRALLFVDGTLHGLVDAEYDGVDHGLDETEFRRLEHCALWQVRLIRGQVAEEVARHRFLQALAGDHPPGPAPWDSAGGS